MFCDARDQNGKDGNDHQGKTGLSHQQGECGEQTNQKQGFMVIAAI